jgi:hypothetical protein
MLSSRDLVFPGVWEEGPDWALTVVKSGENVTARRLGLIVE